MGVFTGILVATDGSEPSQRAVNYAAQLAALDGQPLYVLNVIRDMQFPAALSRMAEVERLVGTRSDVLTYVAEKILKDAKDEARKAGAKEVKTLTRTGDPASAIVEAASHNDASLIVMGTRGLGGMAGALLGSVSRKVSNLAEQNILIIR